MLVDYESDHDVNMYIIYTYKPLHACMNIHTYNISEYCVYAVCIMFMHTYVSMCMCKYVYDNTYTPALFCLSAVWHGYMAFQKGKGQKQQE